MKEQLNAGNSFCSLDDQSLFFSIILAAIGISKADSVLVIVVISLFRCSFSGFLFLVSCCLLLVACCLLLGQENLGHIGFTANRGLVLHADSSPLVTQQIRAPVADTGCSSGFIDQPKLLRRFGLKHRTRRDSFCHRFGLSNLSIETNYETHRGLWFGRSCTSIG